MKTILFLRHGKSDWNARFGRDHERPINERGRTDARRMGRFLAEIECLPDRILSSSAVRARTTLEYAREEGDWEEISTEITSALYEASPADVLALVQEQEDTFERLLLVGHEPTWSTMVGKLVGEAGVRITTATVARVDFRVGQWKQVAFGSGELQWLVTPKLLRDHAE